MEISSGTFCFRALRSVTSSRGGFRGVSDRRVAFCVAIIALERGRVVLLERRERDPETAGDDGRALALEQRDDGLRVLRLPG